MKDYSAISMALGRLLIPTCVGTALIICLPAVAEAPGICTLERQRHFATCMTGPIGDDPDRPPWILPSADCLWLDGDGDYDIDLRDWGMWWCAVERLEAGGGRWKDEG